MEKILNTLRQTLTYKVFKIAYHDGLDLLETIGYMGYNLKATFLSLIKGEVDFQKVIKEAARFGFDSLPLSLTIVALCGMIMALQVGLEVAKQGGASYLGAFITMVINKELGPVMAGFAVISMVGSSMSSEIASMKVTEQVDAIKTLRVDPVEYLITPKTIAGFIIMPFVVVLGNTAGILGGYFIAHSILGINSDVYWDSVWMGLFMKDIFISLFKGFIFGGIIALISTSIGYKTTGGAIDVGNATTKAVVWSITTMAVANYIISYIFIN